MMISILESDFFWGVVIGIILAFISGYYLAYMNIRLLKRHQKETVIGFCIDTVANIQKIIEEMENVRDRAQIINRDYIALINIEIQIFGRNREHTIKIDEQNRSNVRNFMNNCAIKCVDISMNLDKYEQATRAADQIQAEGRQPEADRMRQQAVGFRDKAHAAADRLVNIAKESNSILEGLKKVE